MSAGVPDRQRLKLRRVYGPATVPCRSEIASLLGDAVYQTENTNVLTPDYNLLLQCCLVSEDTEITGRVSQSWYSYQESQVLIKHVHGPPILRRTQFDLTPDVVGGTLMAPRC